MTNVSTGSITNIAWNGPRPLGPEDQLIGRDSEMDELVMQLQSYDIVELTAYSGIGKTSFVQAGVIPKLTEEHTHVPPIVAWPDATSRAYADVTGSLDDSEAARRLYRVVLGLSPDDERAVARALEALADEHEGGVVVVLDQFEELLRFQRGVAEELLRLAGRTARDAGVTHLVIARSEFKEMLRPIEVNGAAVWAISLSEIRSESVLRAIVERPALDAHVAVEEAASLALFSVWDRARNEVTQLRAERRTVEGLEEIGLLHFQSLLWALRQWAGQQDSLAGASTITSADVERFMGGKPPRALLKGALVDYMTFHADRLAAPRHLRGLEDGPPLEWRNGPRLMLSRIAPAMTSAGYKQPQSLFTLIPFALADELTQRTAASLARDLQDDAKPRAQIMGELAEVGDFGAGIADGWNKQVVVEHMLDCLEAALQHMSSRSVGILREFERPGQQPIYELVHDGMGSALTTWAEGFSNDALSTIGVIAAQPGRVIGQSVTAKLLAAKKPIELWGNIEPRDGRMRVSGLKWPASLIDGVIVEDIEFVACNFTGTSFESCTLRNVTFRDCNMLSSVFIRCALSGVDFVVSAEQEDLDSDTAARQGDRLNLVTFVNPRGKIDIEFRGLLGTTGVFLQNLSGGEVRFQRCTVTHLVATASADTGMVLRDSTIRQATFDHRISPDRDHLTVLAGIEWAPSLIEAD